jgi:hypothetical protein
MPDLDQIKQGKQGRGTGAGSPITVENVLNSADDRLPVPAVAVCLVTDGAPATSRKACPSSEQGAGLPARHGESAAAPMVFSTVIPAKADPGLR